MADNNERNPEKLSVELNEAFERLERQQSRQHSQQQAEQSSEDQSNEQSNYKMGSARIETDQPSAPFNFVNTFIALVALGVASYAAFITVTNAENQATTPNPEVERRLESVETRFNAELTRTKGIRAELDTVTRSLSEMDVVTADTLINFQREVDRTVAEIKDRVGTSSQDWLLAEVEYLLRLGTQRVVMEGDAKGALSLFKAADEIVREAEGVTAFELRRAIANDVAKLASVGSVDVSGIFVRLSALANQVPNLKQREYRFEPNTAGQSGLSSTESATELSVEPGFTQRFLSFVRKMWQQTISLVDYRSGDERVTPILPAREEYYLRQNLVLKIQMAQLGLLRGDQTVFDNSLQEARTWISDYFDQEEVGTVAMLAAFDELATLKVKPVLPDVSQSLREARKLLATFHSSTTRSSEKEKLPGEEVE